MLYRVLLIVVALSAYAFGGPQVPKDHQAAPSASGQARDHANGIIPPPRVIADQPTGVMTDQPRPAISTKPNGTKEQSYTQEKPLPWYESLKPEWINVFVTTIYVVVTVFIWRAIKQQVNLLKQQVEDAKLASAETASTASETLKAIQEQADIMERQAIEARESGAQQMKGVQASIAEATRVSKAMEGIAVSMASNVESVRESVGISREIADRQKLATELQSRAYLSASLDGAMFQDANHVFEVHAVLRNTGNTPAYDVTFKAATEIVPMPLPEGFTFPLPDDTAGTSSLIAPTATKLIKRRVPGRVRDGEVVAIKRGDAPCGLAMWGIVKYRDAFKEIRQMRFAFIVRWVSYVEGMDKDKDGNPLPEVVTSYDTTHHNDAD